MLVLGIETSCDETAVAVVEDGRRVLANVVSSQVQLHARYGGVVPELASRQHVEAIVPALEEALVRASCRQDDIEAVAVTIGPGLAGALLVGANFAKALAYARSLPLVPVNHLEAHIYAAWLDGGEAPQFPLLSLIVSGGHSDVVLMTGHGRYRRLGQTVDDAAGEAFDKVARLLGLGFPGGPAVERLAAGAAATALKLPRARLDRPYDFSFSGLKTRVLHLVRGQEGPVPPAAQLAAAFQEAVVDALVSKAVRAAREEGVRRIVLAGGVAANSRLRALLAERSPVPVLAPPPALCTDNGAMVAACGWRRLQAGDVAPLDIDVQPGLRIG
ncbi:MAG TPA: tRNA (adenosine(37)-N6)-threonylcarbamoyltransferase complex transferase subunit TsaD [Dehalococcoidia bacterium]|nr:tRNA (adenosine(37)-N6)-threonylcarbamoyltransferase complex transferase subunit TsaD [Dehalococcoidia bacterium]